MLVLDTGRNTAVWRVEFAPNGTKLVTSTDAAARVFDVATGQRIEFGGYTYFWNGTHASFHPSGQFLIGTGIGAGGPLIYDFEKQKNWREPNENVIEVTRAAFTADGKTVVYIAEPYQEAKQLVCRTWNANGRLGRGWTVTLDADIRSCKALAVLSDGKRFATAHISATHGGQIVIRSLGSGATLAMADFPTAKTNSTPELAVAPDDSIFVAQSQNVLHVFTEIEPEPTFRTVKNSGTKHFTGIAFHPSGKYLAATSNDTTVKLYDTTTWEVARTFTWDIGKMRSIVFSTDGTLAAAGSDSGKVVVWDVDL